MTKCPSAIPTPEYFLSGLPGGAAVSGFGAEASGFEDPRPPFSRVSPTANVARRYRLSASHNDRVDTVNALPLTSNSCRWDAEPRDTVPSYKLSVVVRWRRLNASSTNARSEALRRATGS